MVSLKLSFYYVTIAFSYQVNSIISDCINGHYYSAENCGAFFQCSNGKLFEQRCPGELYFNSVLNVCDFPENVECGGIIESTTTRRNTISTKTITPSLNITRQSTTQNATTQVTTTQDITTRSTPTTQVVTTQVLVPNSLGKIYKLELSKLSFLNAHLFCLNHGMRLATINSQEEQDAVVKLVKQSGLSNDDFWLSGTDLAEEGRFSWLTTGKTFQYTNWAVNQPDNYRQNDHCVHMRNATWNFQWNDAQCHNLKYFICEHSFKC